MTDFAILIVEDEPEVREAIGRDLDPFRASFRIEFAEDTADARAAMADAAERGERIALLLADHLLPGEQGTDFLIALHQDPATAGIRKVLITGQAGHEDTIRAINQAGLDYYIAKPWSADHLQTVVRDQLTEWVLAEADDVLPFVAVLDGPRLLRHVRNSAWDR